MGINDYIKKTKTMNTRKFILADCLDEEQHLIPIDLIRNISPRNTTEGFKSEIKLIGQTNVLFSSETSKELHLKIIKASK